MPKKVAEAYDELWHYTTAAGLQGILASGSVWATSAAFLNDSTETQHFFDARLPELTQTVMRECVQEMVFGPAVAEKSTPLAA